MHQSRIANRRFSLPKLAAALEAVVVTLWVGGLWGIGYLAVPTLFASLSDRMLAGALAGKLLAAMAWTGLSCGGVFLVLRVARFGASALRQKGAWIAVAMLALTLGHFGVEPVLQRLKDEVAPSPVMESRNRQAFATWHGIASGLYLVQSLLGLALVIGREKEIV